MLSLSAMRQKLRMHEDEGDRLRIDIAAYEQRVAELERYVSEDPHLLLLLLLLLTETSQRLLQTLTLLPHWLHEPEPIALQAERLEKRRQTLVTATAAAILWASIRTALSSEV